MAKNIGVVGAPEFVLGFQLAGVRRAVATTSADDYRKAVEAALANREKDLGILIVSAAEAVELPAPTRRKLADAIDPVVIQMGGASGDLREKVKRAIGIDVYKE